MSEHLKEEAMVPYVDGRLSPPERAPLDAHLASCAECRLRVEELRALMGVLGEWRLEQPSPAFDAALRARWSEETEQGRGWFALRPVYGAALAAAVVIAAGVALWPPSTVELPPLPAAPGVAQAPVQIHPVAPTQAQPTQPKTSGTDQLAVLDNPVLLENYEMLNEFDILFEPTPEEKGKTL